MATASQMKKFYNASSSCSSKTISGNFMRLGCAGLGNWSQQDINLGTVNGVEYIDAGEVKQGINKSFYSDNASFCCILVGHRIVDRNTSKVLLAHIPGAAHSNAVKNELLKFQPNLNAAIKFYMFTMRGPLKSGIDYGDDCGFSGALDALSGAYGTGALNMIARQTIIVTGYQGVEWDNTTCGVYARPHGVYPVSSQAPCFKEHLLFGGVSGWK